MFTDAYAVDLPAIEPTTADLALLETEPWCETQEHLEQLIAEQATTNLRRAVNAPVRTLPTHTYDMPTEEVAA